jgi:putative sigma-54 modulation protein
MELTVTFRHFEPNDALRNHAQEKVSRIEKHISNATEVHVILSLEKRTHIAEVIVNVNRAKITAKEVNADNMYTAIDLVMDKIERQVRKYKDKITSHKDQHRKARQNIFSFEGSEKIKQPNIVKTESVFIKTFTIDEAILHIESVNDDFLVFRNLETEKVNVLYRRRDGDLGLIESENA